jgi:hypothetical protein
MSISLNGTITKKENGAPIARATVRLFGAAEPLGDVRAAAVHREDAVAWTRVLTGFAGVRWNAWQKYVMNYVAGITWPEFNEQVLEHNPHLAADGGNFIATKSYKMPEQAGEQPPFRWTRPLTGFDGSRWDCWLKYVQGKVDGITWPQFADEVAVQNPVLVEDDHMFLPNKSYMLPENEPGSTALSWTRSLSGFRGSRWVCWRDHVEGRVACITRGQFFADVVTYNPFLAQDGYVFLANKTYVLPENPMRPSYYLYSTTDNAGRFAFELLTTPGSYALIVQAPGYHTYVQQFLLSRDTERNIALVSTEPAMRSDWDGYHSAPTKVKRLIDQALALLGDDVLVYDSLGDELVDLATGSLHLHPSAPHYKDIVCADLVTMALHTAGVDHVWPVTEPPGTIHRSSHAANYYRPSQHNALLRVVEEHEDWLPGDILIYWNGDLSAERVKHVNLYVGPFSGVDLSGNEHPASENYEVVNASIDFEEDSIELGVATLPMTKAFCVNTRCGYESMRRLRHVELWD